MVFLGNTSYTNNLVELQTVVVDEVASGDNPQVDLEVITAPGAGKRIAIHGWDFNLASTASNNAWALTDGDYSGGKFLMASTVYGGTSATHSMNFSSDKLYVSENAAVNLSVAEASGQVYIYGIIFYKVEDI